MIAEESDYESTLEREQNEIAERQRALSARREKKRKERMTNQQAAEKKAEAERDQDAAKFLEEEDERHSDSEDSSHHRIPSTGRARNKARKLSLANAIGKH